MTGHPPCSCTTNLLCPIQLGMRHRNCCRPGARTRGSRAASSAEQPPLRTELGDVLEVEATCGDDMQKRQLVLQGLGGAMPGSGRKAVDVVARAADVRAAVGVPETRAIRTEIQAALEEHREWQQAQDENLKEWQQARDERQAAWLDTVTWVVGALQVTLIGGVLAYLWKPEAGVGLAAVGLVGTYFKYCFDVYVAKRK